MTTFLVFLHVAAAILLIGPVCVSTSSFQTQMAKAAQGEHAALGSARVLHNITNTYGYISAIVPILGLGVFLSDISAYKSEVNFHIAILVAIVASLSRRRQWPPSSQTKPLTTRRQRSHCPRSVAYLTSYGSSA